MVNGQTGLNPILILCALIFLLAQIFKAGMTDPPSWFRRGISRRIAYLDVLEVECHSNSLVFDGLSASNAQAVSKVVFSSPKKGANHILFKTTWLLMGLSPALHLRSAPARLGNESGKHCESMEVAYG
jgi:hypothetical protein